VGTLTGYDQTAPPNSSVVFQRSRLPAPAALTTTPATKRGFERAYGDDTPGSRELWTFTDVDFARIADDMGALGIRVTKPSELEPAIERALDAGRPAIVDVVTSPEVLAPLAVT
jgi:hypothetical protein